MPLSNSAVPNKGHDLSSNFPLSFAVSLNEIIRETLRKIQLHHHQVECVLRCESLPSIRGEKEDYLKVFETIFGLIFHSTTGRAKLFLYVDCEETNKKTRAGSEGMRTYIIKINTNIIADENWRAAHSAVLACCQQILIANKGDLHIKTLDPAGCIFSLSVPGKFH